MIKTKCQDPLNITEARQYALKYLARQNLHSLKLKKNLSEKGYENLIIEKIIEEFKTRQFLDDEKWIENFFEIGKKRYSSRFLLSKLRAIGIPLEEIVLKQLDLNIDNEESEKLLLMKLLKTRYKNKNLSLMNERKKIVAALFRKGFSLDLILSCIGEEN